MEYSFPFEPYQAQLDLMREIVRCIDEGKVGIFESPTGTGKTMSILCATMSWLERHNADVYDTLKERTAKHVDDSGETDWIAAHKRKMEQMKDVDEANEQLDYLNRVAEKIADAKAGVIEENRKRRLDDSNADNDMNNGDQADDGPPDSYESDGEVPLDAPEEPLKVTKVFYASRTHSQLEQVADELKKTRFHPRILTVASRSTLCANEQVTRLKYAHLINEKCMELRKKSSGEKRSCDENKTSKKCSGGCSYFKSDPIEDLSNGIIAGRLKSPNEVMKQGKQSVACPYFASRRALPLCEIVLVPYQVILHSATRAAWGIDLKDNVVVLDEAHNVMQAVGSIYSTELTSSSISNALALIRQYIDTYKLRLKNKNLVYMRQLLTVVTALDKFLSSSKNNEVLTIAALMLKLGIHEINLTKLSHFIESTDMCRKFHGFFVRMRTQQAKQNKEPVKSGLSKLLAKKTEVQPESTLAENDENRPQPSPLFVIKAFIESLNSRCEDGRIIVERQEKSSRYRFVLLNPAERLNELVQQARSVVLLGGTMEPSALLVDCLSRGGLKNGLNRFNCGHVIDDNQLLAIPIGRSARNQQLTLTYQTKSNNEMIRELGESLLSLISNVPNGCVAFFTSYDFLYSFVDKLKQLKIYERITEKKSFFVEQRGSDSVWERFSTSARTSRGALLCAVVGGKLSEGINFSDELGRAVFMLGLPYPNKTSVELQEKMKYMDSVVANGGRELYSSLCMHAVNQAVGRAIRHRRDYAAVFLVDSRFGDVAVSSQLSPWIAQRLRSPMAFSECLRLTTDFFATKRALK